MKARSHKCEKIYDIYYSEKVLICSEWLSTVVSIFLKITLFPWGLFGDYIYSPCLSQYWTTTYLLPSLQEKLLFWLFLSLLLCL